LSLNVPWSAFIVVNQLNSELKVQSRGRGDERRRDKREWGKREREGEGERTHTGISGRPVASSVVIESLIGVN